MKKIYFTFLGLILIFLKITSYAADAPTSKQFGLPKAAYRTYAQNYKDSALAFCIAKAYESEPKTYTDAIATADGLDNWGSYDIENSTGEIPRLVKSYLIRDYPSFQGPTIKLNLLKCIDLYHSKELEELVKRYVSEPNRTYRQDNPSA